MALECTKSAECTIWSFGRDSNGAINQKHIVHKLKKKHIGNIVISRDGATYILLTDGGYIAFGNNKFGRLGISSSELIVSKKTKIKFESTQIKQIFSGIASNHSFMLTQSDQLYGVGWNQYNQIMHTSSQPEARSELKSKSICSDWVKITALPLSIRIKSIATSYRYTHFLSTNGELFVCGSDPHKYGQLGLGPNRATSANIERMQTNIKFKAIASGAYHSIAVDIDDALYSWGYGKKGVLGHGDYRNVSSPKRVFFGEHKTACVKKISCGKYHNVVIEKTSGTVLYFRSCIIFV